MLLNKATNRLLPHGYRVGNHQAGIAFPQMTIGIRIPICSPNPKSSDHFRRKNIQRYGMSSSSKVPTSGHEKRKAALGEQFTLHSSLPTDIPARNPRLEKHSLTDWCPRKPKSTLQGSAYYELASTRPGVLDLPKDPPLQNEDLTDSSSRVGPLVKHYFRIAKGYYKFYKSGLKSVWSNYKQYRKIMERAHAFDRIHWTTPKHEMIPKLKAAFDAKQITRQEYNLYLRTRRDLRKLVPFLMIFAIFGEFSPLVLLPLGPRVVPFPCLLPKQVIQQCQADQTIDHVTLKTGQKNVERELPTIPSHQTWKAFRPQLLHLDKTISWSPDGDRERCIGSNWYKAKSFSVERPLADALLILWEGGVDTLDDAEVLLKAWSFHDPYLAGLWERAYFASQRRRTDKTIPTTDHVAGWENLKLIDLTTLRQELQLSLEDLVAHLDFYFKTGLDYDPSNPVHTRSQHVNTGKTTR